MNGIFNDGIEHLGVKPCFSVVFTSHLTVHFGLHMLFKDLQCAKKEVNIQ